MQIDLTGRTALVTGSTSGIGYATAHALASSGATVVINGRDAGRVAKTVQELQEVGTVTGVAADIGSATGIAELIAAVPNVDILVNNAGVFAATPFFEISDIEWSQFFDINVLSGIRLTRHYGPAMVERGWGRVIFVSSESAVQIPTEMVHYGMTKTAQLAISRGVAQTVSGSGVTVNSVLPGPTLTPGVREFIANRVGTDIPFADAERQFIAQERPTSLLGRLIRPEEVANMITYLASEAASATTGAAVRVDGGVANTIIP